MKSLNRAEVAHTVTDIFGEPHIITAFLTGGIAAGTATEQGDIDIFVCHDGAIATTAEDDFRSYYFDLHEQTNREPDIISPGEVMSDTELNRGLSRLREIQPSTVLHERREFDYICWAGMLVSKKELFVPVRPELTVYENLALSIIDDWVRALHGPGEYTYATGGTTDPDKLLARTISCPGYYDAHI